LLHVGVVAQRKVATAHVHPAQAVAMPIGRAEAIAQRGLLLRLRQSQPTHRRRLRERAAKAEQALELAAAVHGDFGQGGGRSLGLQRQCGQGAETVRAVLRAEEGEEGGHGRVDL
jgi:hypothetical protein